jgi:hypothetical protein
MQADTTESRRLHVVGCHRSGTTLMFEMLSACFRHDGRCEHEQSIFDPAGTDVALYFSKKPSDITYIHRVFRRDPGLHLIYMRRDPRAVVTSIHASRGDRYFSSFARWRRYEAAVTRLGEHPRLLCVRFEDLVRSPDRIQNLIQQRFDFLTSTGSFSGYADHANTSPKAEISMGGLRAPDVHRIDGWRNHLPRLAFQVERHPDLLDAVIEAGYETGYDWISELQGITPRRQQHGESGPPFWKRWETELRYLIKARHYLKEKSRKKRAERKT